MATTSPTPLDPFGARATLTTGQGTTVAYYRLGVLADMGLTDLDRLPFTVRVLLENVLRNAGGEFVTREHVEALAGWRPRRLAGTAVTVDAVTEVGGNAAAGAGSAAADDDMEVPFLPARVLLQDFTGVPCVVDLAAMRSAMERLGGDVTRINPLVPVDLVIDHSVQVDAFGTTFAIARNKDLEYQRNGERYALLRWGQQSFQNFRAVPPGTGIVHQVNLEYLASVVASRQSGNDTVAFPDTLVGTDSHTTMVNGLGVLGWGVGGIEAEAVMLGQPLYQLAPEVVGVKLSGGLREGATATDLVLTITEMLRAHGVVGRFVEFFGRGLSSLTLADRATISNMSPEYGATAALFPVDEETLRYLRLTARADDQVDLVEKYCRAQSLFRTDETPDPEYDETLALELDDVRPSVAGPRRPQDRVDLGQVRQTFRQAFKPQFGEEREGGIAVATEVARYDWEAGTVNEEEQSSTATVGIDPRAGEVAVRLDGIETTMHHGSVAIAAITSCTNTSNPSVMLGAGLLAKAAVERGLKVPAFVKTSMAPGSQVVTRYLERSDLLPYLEALGFHVIGYGCTTCIGNSGPLPAAVAEAVDANELVVAAVLSGNRNFEGRIHPQVRASFLASPPLVVAYALAGSVDIDLETDPIGHDPNGDAVYLRDIWPTREDIAAATERSLDSDIFRQEYKTVFAGDEHWQGLPVPDGNLYEWDAASTYVQEPPFFADFSDQAPADVVAGVTGARVLALLGDSVTTDHISPAGSIARTSPAGAYLIEQGVKQHEFNSYGSRRGNHEVMIRGTFANIRLQNALAGGKEGNVTVHLPSGDEMSIYDAAMRYVSEGTPLMVIAGKEYGSGSSRDWAAKGTLLLGVKAVLAESFERIHRSNLVGMGVLPLQFLPGESAASHGLTGRETLDITGLTGTLAPRARFSITATGDDGTTRTFEVIARIDSPVEVRYYQNGGILPTVLRRLTETGSDAALST
ncbi:MAG: aconitate hydratase AcnA [Chloroflexota bacterium]|nr:aconitate hydratase AcnA [Chloroflexota bacterium]